METLANFFTPAFSPVYLTSTCIFKRMAAH